MPDHPEMTADDPTGAPMHASGEQLPPFTDEVLSEIHTHTVNHGRQMEIHLPMSTRPQDGEPTARALLWPS